MSQIKDNVRRIRERIAVAAERAGRDPGEVELMAVTKNRAPAEIQEALEAGIRHVGENYVQEADAKFGQVDWPPDATRHLIGHLQSNKARKALDIFNFFDSTDSLKLARRLDAMAAERAILLPILLEIRLTDEAEKTGLEPEFLPGMLEELRALKHLRLAGLMGMAPFTQDQQAQRSAFRALKRHFLTLDNNSRHILSMGMTGDFEMAIEEGSTMIRIGTALFGAREA
jgi:PLP dependent protein